MAFNIGDKVRPRFCTLNKDKVGEVSRVYNKHELLINIVKFSEYNDETEFAYSNKELMKQDDRLLNWLRDGKKV